jgi:putative ABC transport system permease protein
MDTLRQDIAYAARRLARAPGFTLVALLTLALGIGANGAIFSVVNAVLLKPLPFAEPDRLVTLSQTWKGTPGPYSPQNFLDVAKSAHSFESLAAFDPGGLTLTGQGTPVRLDGAEVSASFFDVLGVAPERGRGFATDENEPGRTRVVVLGHALWRERFGGDPAILGRSISLNREPYVVVGVTKPGFAFPEGAQLWRPLTYDQSFGESSRGSWYLHVVARLKPAVRAQAAGDELSAIAAHLARAYPAQNEGVGAQVTSLHESLVGDSRRGLLVLLGAVGLVLLIACVNVANLLLARNAARRTEIAVRAALGAGRARLVRQLLTEGLLLAVLGGALGLLVASVALDALLAFQPEGVARLREVRMDGTVTGFAFLLSLATGLLFGTVPALSLTRDATAHSLRESARTSTSGDRTRAALVVSQIALAMMLLAGAGLLIRSFTQLRRVDPGFDPRSTLTLRVSLPDAAYTEGAQISGFYQALLARVRELPGVTDAGAVTGLPLTGARFSLSFEVEGRPPVPPAQQPSMEVRVATPGYFSALRVPVLRGRSFAERDGATAPQVVLLSETAVRRYFPDEDPLGQRIEIGLRRAPGQPKAGGVVIGVVGDVKDRGLAAAPPPEIYLPYAQLPTPTMDLVVRTSQHPLALAPSVEAAVHALDRELPVTRTQALEDVVARSLSEPRFYTLLLGVFGGSALLLAALGVFGVMSFSVARRARELGIRVALGADPGDVRRLVLRQAVLIAIAGVAWGLAGALALSHLLASLLFNLSPADPATLGTVALLLTAVAVLASYLPARRATRADPLVVLRAE